MLLYITATVVIGIAVSIAGIRDEMCSRPLVSLLPLGNFSGPTLEFTTAQKLGCALLTTPVCNVELTLEFTQRYNRHSEPVCRDRSRLRRSGTDIVGVGPAERKSAAERRAWLARFIKASQVGMNAN